MKVSGLIEYLKKLPQEYEVMSLDGIEEVNSRVSEGSITISHTSRKVFIEGDYYDIDHG